MEFEFTLLSPMLVWSTTLGLPGRVAYACTNIQHVASEKNKKVTLHILTHGAMRRCGLISLVLCLNDTIVI